MEKQNRLKRILLLPFTQLLVQLIPAEVELFNLLHVHVHNVDGHRRKSEPGASCSTDSSPLRAFNTEASRVKISLN